MRKGKKLFVLVLALIVLGIVIGLGANHMNGSYGALSKGDQEILAEYNKLYEALQEEPLWEDFNLQEEGVVVISKDSLNSYIINGTGVDEGLFTKEIQMPNMFSLTSVHRIAALTPQMLKLRGPGNFNTIGKKYSIFGEEVYFVKYDSENSLERINSSQHFAPFLAHESFHYYMQNNWRFDDIPIEGLNKEGLALLKEEYIVLARLQEERIKGYANKELLLSCAKELVMIVDKRLENNKDYVGEELIRETAEGSATYVGIKAAEIVGYDFGIMYFDNAKDISFSEVFPQLENGKIEEEFLYSRMPYETGAELCFLLDTLEVPDWQRRLNEQTKQDQETLYSVLKDFVM